jgi:hypothetical protein
MAFPSYLRMLHSVVILRTVSKRERESAGEVKVTWAPVLHHLIRSLDHERSAISILVQSLKLS